MQGWRFLRRRRSFGPPFSLYKMKCQFSDRRVSTSLRPGHGDGNGILDSLNHRCPDLLLTSGATESATESRDPLEPLVLQPFPLPIRQAEEVSDGVEQGVGVLGGGG